MSPLDMFYLALFSLTGAIVLLGWVFLCYKGVVWRPFWTLIFVPISVYGGAFTIIIFQYYGQVLFHKLSGG